MTKRIILHRAILFFLFTALFIFQDVILSAGEQYQLLDAFETHNWHAPQWGKDTSMLTFSTDWKTQGRTSMKLSAEGYSWSCYITGCFDTERPKKVILDVYAKNYQRIKVEIVDSDNIQHALGGYYLDDNTTNRNLSFSLTNSNSGGYYNMRQMRIVQDWYSESAVAYVDNIRIVKGPVITLWDPCEDHYYWDGSADADNRDGEVSRSDDITHALYSPNGGSTASLVMEWESQVDKNARSAEIQMKNLNLDLSKYWYFRFDAYRPSTTSNVNLMVYLWDGKKGASTIYTRINTPDQWTTIKVPIWEPNNLSSIKEVKFVVPETKKYERGRLYFDNLMVGGFIPEPTPVDLSLVGYPHMIKDFSDNFDGNKFHGLTGIGGGIQGTIKAQISRKDFHTLPALRLDYNLKPKDSFIYYYNTLKTNSVKKNFVVYLKGGKDNPGRLKLEFHDKTWNYINKGCAYCFLSGISSEKWQQWIVPLDPSKMALVGSFDPANITEVVFSLDKRTANNNAKSGTFFIDDMTFVDASDKKTPYTGIISPEPRSLSLKSLGYPHMVKNFSDGPDRNKFYGITGIGTGHGGIISQEISSNEFYTRPALKIIYNVSNTNSYLFYYNTLKLNSKKNMLSLFLKGETNNPGTIKLELHDRNWNFTTGGAYAYLEGMVSTSWKQWLVPVDPTKLIIMGTFDPGNITEVVLTVDKQLAKSKTGTFYVDDIAFIDSSDVLTRYPGLAFPQSIPFDPKSIGVPYTVDDFDGRVIDGSGKEIDMGYTEFGGYVGANGGAGGKASMSISSIEAGGPVHSLPFARKINYNVTKKDSYIYYYNLLSKHGDPRDFSGMARFSLWLRSVPGGNPGMVRVEFHDSTWGVKGNYTSGNAYCVLSDISDSQWKQYVISTKNQDLTVLKSFDISRLKEVVISLDEAMAKDKKGTLYIDDMQFIDINKRFVADADFKKDQFLDLVERRTFQYFLDAYDKKTGLVFDRVHYEDLATISGTGFGLTAMVVGTERGWIKRSEAKAYVLKVFNTLLDTPQATTTNQSPTNMVFPQGKKTYYHSKESGYRGFYYHFLEASTGTRKFPTDYNTPPVELSVVDTALFLTGVITARQYFSEDHEIMAKADQLYNRVDWDWFLDTSNPDTNPNYHQFYLGWAPENGWAHSGERVLHWDFSSDENILMDLIAIGSTTHPVPADIFYKWRRDVRSYKGRKMIVSFNGSMFQYFFANIWFDLFGKQDALGVNWWKNSVQAGLANRDFCIAGTDYTKRKKVSTFHALSWGLTSCEGIPRGLNWTYLGGNGALPNGAHDVFGDPLSPDVDGTVATYGAISMIGFSGHAGGIPVPYILDTMKNYYKNTQLWGGWYGFRDSYTDADVRKPRATSKYPLYKPAYFAIDQGPILLMIENYRTGLIWNRFMSNLIVQNGMRAVFGTGDLTYSGRCSVASEPQDMALSPDGSDMYIADTTTNSPYGIVKWYTRDPFTGGLSYKNMYSHDNLNGIQDVEVSPEGKWVYAQAPKARAITWFSRNIATGTLKYCGEVINPDLETSRAMTISPDGRHLYVISPSKDSVFWFARDISTGVLSYSGSYSSVNIHGAWSLKISPDGKNAYVAASEARAIVWFRRNPLTGNLTYGSRYTNSFLKGVRSMALSYEGKNVYAISPLTDSLFWFNRDSSAGDLSYGGRYSAPLINKANDIEVSGDGKNIYVTSPLSSGAAWFKRNILTGSIMYMRNYSNTVYLKGASFVRISPTGSHVYVLSPSTQTIVWFNRQ